jgi:hypothetical protein
MWTKTKEQLPAVLLTALITIGAIVGYSIWLRDKVIAEVSVKQKTEMAALRESTEARIKETSDQLRTQIGSTHQLLQDAINNRKGELFMGDEELARLNQEKVDILAAAIAGKIQPGVPLPKDPEEAKRIRDEQMDEVAGKMAGKIQPILVEMSRDQKLTQSSIAQYSERISDQISSVLTSELAAKQKLTNNLMETTAIAQQSMRLSQELTALYLAQLKDESLLGRVFTLPARLIQDTARGSIINSNECKKIEGRIAEDMKALQQRLDSVQANMPGQPLTTAAPMPERVSPTRPQ